MIRITPQVDLSHDVWVFTVVILKKKSGIMRTILIPTDFSKTAVNAVQYGTALAYKLKANVVLIHAFRPPVIVSDVVVMPTIRDVEKNCVRRLKDLKAKIIAKYPKMEISVVCKLGFASEVLINYIKAERPDWVVMGVQGAGYIKGRLFGSTATDILASSPIPVITVDQNLKFTSPKRIVVAVDQKAINKKKLKPLLELTSIFKSELYLLHVSENSKTMPTLVQAAEGIKLEHSIETVKHGYYFLEGDDVVAGINRFIKEKKSDMVVMFPRKHSFMERLFKDSNTRKITFQLKAPLLTIAS